MAMEWLSNLKRYTKLNPDRVKRGKLDSKVYYQYWRYMIEIIQ
jgi:hypothetical protein